MATASLSFVHIEMGNGRVGETTFSDLLFLSHSKEIPKQVLDSFRRQSFTFGRFLSCMGLKKISFQASPENLQPATVAKICGAMSRFAEAKQMKDVAMDMLSKEDFQSIMMELAQESANEATEEYEKARQAYLDECADNKIEVILGESERKTDLL